MAEGPEELEKQRKDFDLKIFLSQFVKFLDFKDPTEEDYKEAKRLLVGAKEKLAENNQETDEANSTIQQVESWLAYHRSSFEK